jgi:formyl-CoA transferase/CoA:oxalate CoA-transferase
MSKRDATHSSTPAPLDGIRVCDVTQNLAGPFCGQILADLGATVIKVEPPGGDLGRRWGPPFWGSDSTLYLSANRGKRSIVLDLKQPEGMAVLRRLADGADVFLQASRPAAAKRLGIDFESVKACRPDVIHMSVTAYGAEGPLRDQPGYDPLMQAFSGIMSVTGHPGGDPTRVGGSVVDFGTGMWAAIAILGALRTRDRTGEGARLETSLLDTSLAWVSYHVMGYLASGEVPGPMGSALGAIAPYRAFRTSDGNVMIAVGNDAIFQRFCGALGLDELPGDERFASNPARVANRDVLERLVEERTVRLSTGALLQSMRRCSVPASPIQSIDQVVEHDQVAEADMLHHSPHHRGEGYRDVSLPLKVMGVRPRAAEPPPRIGEHTVDVLRELGYEEGDVLDLLERGIAVAAG